jgi:hypothetical protein
MSVGEWLKLFLISLAVSAVLGSFYGHCVCGFK